MHSSTSIARAMRLRLRYLAAAALVISIAGITNMSLSAEKLTLKVVKVDSEETSGEDGKGANAVDGDPNTLWHTKWQDDNPEHPHEIIIELSRACKIIGFTYLPRQDESVNGTIKDYEFYVSAEGDDFGKPVKNGRLDEGKGVKTVSFEPRQCRFVKLKAISEINDQAWTSAAEIGVVEDTGKPTLKVVRVDSEETSGEDGKGANAVDGDPNTFWHTQWQDGNPEPPHEIVIELSRPCNVSGFTYLPRQDESDHGTIKDYEFYVSDDGKAFGAAVKKGRLGEGKDKKTVSIEPKQGRFIKLKALSDINNEPWTSAAEIDVLVD
jgi:endo-alpha-N-acetylgalactosaminidase